MHRRLQTNDAFAKFLSVKSFLAVRDTDAPPGNYGQKIIKDGNEMKAAPFYLVYQGISAKETDLEWPYNLIKYTLSLMMKTSHSCFKRNKADLAMNYSKKLHLSCH
jgi:hypothetical protein